MIGVRMSALTVSYGECSELIEKLQADKDATTIRYLCKLRTVLMQKFKKTDDLMRFQLKNLHNIEWYDTDNIKQLEKWGFTIIQANCRSEKYMQEFTRLINENIDKCSQLFYDWLNWEYVRDLFFVPKYNKNGVMKAEFNKYMANIEHYPFQMYIHWQPAEVGSIIYSDRKFLKIIYGQHNDSFTDYTKYRDADDETRNNIDETEEPKKEYKIIEILAEIEIFLRENYNGRNKRKLSQIYKIRDNIYSVFSIDSKELKNEIIEKQKSRLPVKINKRIIGVRKEREKIITFLNQNGYVLKDENITFNSNLQNIIKKINLISKAINTETKMNFKNIN